MVLLKKSKLIYTKKKIANKVPYETFYAQSRHVVL